MDKYGAYLCMYAVGRAQRRKSQDDRAYITKLAFMNQVLSQIPDIAKKSLSPQRKSFTGDHY